MNKLVRLNKKENARIERLCLEYFSVNSILFFSIHEFTRRYAAVLSSLENSEEAGQAHALWDVRRKFQNDLN